MGVCGTLYEQLLVRTCSSHFNNMGKKGSAKKRAQRATSNVFAMFDQSQVQEFKEAFNMIDQDRDGFISNEDLKDMQASLGHITTDEETQAMIKEAPGAINECDEMFNEAKVDKKGNFNYLEYVRLIKHGPQDE